MATLIIRRIRVQGPVAGEMVQLTPYFLDVPILAPGTTVATAIPVVSLRAGEAVNVSWRTFAARRIDFFTNASHIYLRRVGGGNFASVDYLVPVDRTSPALPVRTAGRVCPDLSGQWRRTSFTQDLTGTDRRYTICIEYQLTNGVIQLLLSAANTIVFTLAITARSLLTLLIDGIRNIFSPPDRDDDQLPPDEGEEPGEPPFQGEQPFGTDQLIQAPESISETEHSVQEPTVPPEQDSQPPEKG